MVASLTALTIGFGSLPAADAQPTLPQLPSGDLIQDLLPQLPGVPGFTSSDQPGAKQIVAFGDSFTANAGKGGPRGLQASPYPWTVNCATDMENWPKLVGERTGKTVGDWSCNGTGGMPVVQLMAYVESAILHGDIAPGTEKVVLMYGGMDALQWVDTAGTLTATLNDESMTVFRQLVAWVRDRVGQVAPGAEVVLASYPEFASGDELCLVNLPGQTFPIPAPGGKAVQEALRDNIRNAAHATGVDFIDVYQESLGHGTCAPDAERWTAGVFDPQIGPMPNHPTVQGEYGIAGIIASHV